VLTIARRYAGALADVIIERGETSEVLSELQYWQAMIEQNSDLREVFSNPTVAYEEKRKVLNELIGLTRVRQTTANFLQVLLKNQRISELAEINRRLAQELDERAGVVAARVTTARPISDDIKQTIHRRLTDMSEKKVRVDFETNTDIIGGLVTRIGSTVYDGSIKTQLELLAGKLGRN
jgi:F-type H+-transporting ATPase subunit delta